MVAREAWVTSENGSEAGSGRGRLLNVRWKEKEIARTIAGKTHFGTRHNESILVLSHIVRYLADFPVSILHQGMGKTLGGLRERASGRKTRRPRKKKIFAATSERRRNI
jgi:hypothetical protein